MSLNRTSLWLAAWALVLLAPLPASAQDLRDMKLFAPADLGSYGSGIQPKEGYFFVFDGLYWSISAPEVTTVGFPNLTRNVYYGPFQTDLRVQSNTLDTGFLRSPFTDGNRIEFGRMTDRGGWLLSTYRLNSQTQRHATSSVDIVFVDDAFGPLGSHLLEGIVGTIPDPADPTLTIPVIADLPVTFDNLVAINRLDTWSLELMYMQRSRAFDHNGFIEWYAGVRYLEFDDLFSVDAVGEEPDPNNPPNVPAVLADSNWVTEAENHIVGPQVGVRLFRKRRRWMFTAEGRFLAGFNSQNIRQHGALGSDLNPPPDPTDANDYFKPLVMAPTSFTHVEHIREWSPLVELRAEVRYQLTRAVSFRAGWTGIWVDGIARASDMINYEVPDMGFRLMHNRQDVLINGLTIGVDINR